MCGIAGVVAKEPIETAVVERMLAAISYRGPDHREAQSYELKGNVHLCVGQARLAIIDLSPDANQPFERDGGGITFNGEFYNFQNVRNELAGEGDVFRTQSDTEVALAALNRHGVEALNRLDGMFAGVFVPPDRSRIFLFRDRFGKKPLYLYETANRLYFASEPKAILAVLDHVPQPDPDALAHYFYLGYIPSQFCAFMGMWKLPAGAWVEIGPDGVGEPQRWWRPETETAPPESELASLFEAAVAKRMIADVPLAAFLSGGLDSSLVVAAMSRLSSQKVSTFSVRFQGPQAFDESGFARQMAEFCQTDHHEIPLDPSILREAMPEVLAHFDEPFGDASAVPMYVVSRAAREQFTVALSGDGADEIFAGYRKYLGPHYLAKLGPYAIRRLLWRPLSRLVPSGRRNRFLETGRRIKRLLDGDAADAATRHVHWLHMSPIPASRLAGPELPSFASVRRGLIARLPSDATLNDCLRFDQDLVMQDDMFVKVDRMSMKASLEVRSPFVDHRLVLLANALSPERKLHGLTRKRTLLEGLGHMLPPDILSRPKAGFEMPTGAWLRNEMRTWAEDRLFHTTDTSAWVDRKALRQVFDKHCSGLLDCTETLWFHIVFADWLERTYR